MKKIPSTSLFFVLVAMFFASFARAEEAEVQTFVIPLEELESLNGDSQVVELLIIEISERPDLSAVDSNGMNLLHQSVLKGDLFAMEWLIESKMDLNAKNADGYTALHMALRQSHFQRGVEREHSMLMAIDLIFAGADLDTLKDPHGHKAVAYLNKLREDPKTFDALFTKPDDLNRKDTEGYPRLHRALRALLLGKQDPKEQLEAKILAGSLILAGADLLKIKDPDGYPALDYLNMIRTDAIRDSKRESSSLPLGPF